MAQSQGRVAAVVTSKLASGDQSRVGRRKVRHTVACQQKEYANEVIFRATSVQFERVVAPNG